MKHYTAMGHLWKSSAMGCIGTGEITTSRPWLNKQGYVIHRGPCRPNQMQIRGERMVSISTFYLPLHALPIKECRTFHNCLVYQKIGNVFVIYMCIYYPWYSGQSFCFCSDICHFTTSAQMGLNLACFP